MQRAVNEVCARSKPVVSVKAAYFVRGSLGFSSQKHLPLKR
jgi:hypothetical protein